MHNTPNKIQKAYWGYRNKVTNKFFGVVHMPANGKRKGYILISYITEPFTLGSTESFSSFHTMYWECYEIARLFSEKGYAVDVINAKNHTFIPKKKYTVCIDVEDNFERLFPHLPRDCKKVFHILIPNWDAYNAAEAQRLQNLKNRRGIELIPRRKVNPSRDAELADFLEGYGNKAIFKSFDKFGKKPHLIPISAVILYPYPENKNWSEARKHFLWIGGGGVVLKGLDLVLESFCKTPDLHLHVCGPVFGEKDFVGAYEKELLHTSNIHAYGRIDVTGKQFLEVIEKCGSVIYPSAAEGTSGAIVQAMHAGLVPIITHEVGIQENAGYIPLIDPNPESVREATISFSQRDNDDLKKHSYSIWKYARDHYTREEFSKAYNNFITNILHL